MLSFLNNHTLILNSPIPTVYSTRLSARDSPLWVQRPQLHNVLSHSVTSDSL